ncbi:unnamed protein product [Plutella xylostella]|uniref:(diamondback moth) hypothetical protein n=1 Tax=Plutella xylostella TaxID=51655 RepID=A0A8S4DQL4_PLUXY|nr:unnamed protein product [Plutella xylostella]
MTYSKWAVVAALSLLAMSCRGRARGSAVLGRPRECTHHSPRRPSVVLTRTRGNRVQNVATKSVKCKVDFSSVNVCVRVRASSAAGGCQCV